MNIDQIENFLSNISTKKTKNVKITFKKREAIYGLFVLDADYNHLKSKNFWRIVTTLHLDQFQKTGDMSLARIFNGSEFTRLLPHEETV